MSVTSRRAIRARRGRRSFRFEFLARGTHVLDAERDACERASRPTFEIRALGAGRFLARPVEAERREGAEGRVQLLDAGAEGIDDLRGRELVRAVALEQPDGGEERESSIA